MHTKNIEDLSFDELTQNLVEQALNGIIRGEKFATIIRGVAEGAVYWRSEKTKAEEKAVKAALAGVKVIVKGDPITLAIMEAKGMTAPKR